MVNWLKTNLIKTPSSIVKAGIFGSVALDVITANDCDLYIVSAANPNSIEWWEVKNYLNEFKVKFYSTFEIPLNVVLFTVSEWEELKLFFTKNRPIKLRVEYCVTR